MEDVQFMKEMNAMIQFGFVEDHCMYYGNFLVSIEGIEWNIVEFQKRDGSENALDGNECFDNGIIAIQLDDVNESDLTTKGKKNWKTVVTVVCH